MTIQLYKNDIPPDLALGHTIAIDTETRGLKPLRDRLCLMQLSSGDGHAHLVQFEKDTFEAPNLKKVLANPDVLKIFHYARFDVAVIQHYLNVTCAPLYCTKIASKLARTYTDRHSLKTLVKEILEIDLSKEQQCSDWASPNLTPAQQAYAASDVLYLHQLKEKLDETLKTEEREAHAKACFDFIPTRAALDLEGFEETDIFSHS